MTVVGLFDTMHRNWSEMRLIVLVVLLLFGNCFGFCCVCIALLFAGCDCVGVRRENLQAGVPEKDPKKACDWCCKDTLKMSPLENLTRRWFFAQLVGEPHKLCHSIKQLFFGLYHPPHTPTPPHTHTHTPHTHTSTSLSRSIVLDFVLVCNVIRKTSDSAFLDCFKFGCNVNFFQVKGQRVGAVGGLRVGCGRGARILAYD
jgi:hypothetical protein